MSHNELCVYDAGNVEEANIVVAWLADHDIKAILPDEHTIATLGMPTILPGHVEVCVTDRTQLAEARALIAEHNRHLKEHVAAAGVGGEIPATCEKCGTTSTFPYSEAGHVVECPECNEYLDVPDPTDVG